jgi:hypothetical protein
MIHRVFLVHYLLAKQLLCLRGVASMLHKIHVR